jgi:hypothetical protein
VGFSIDNFANEYIVTNIVPIGLPFSISVKVGIHGVVGVEFFRYIDNESETVYSSSQVAVDLIQAWTAYSWANGYLSVDQIISLFSGWLQTVSYSVVPEIIYLSK